MKIVFRLVPIDPMVAMNTTPISTAIKPYSIMVTPELSATKSRMERGAMIVFDDYGFSSCKGITRLVDELRTDGHWQYFYNLNKHAILVKR